MSKGRNGDTVLLHDSCFSRATLPRTLRTKSWCSPTHYTRKKPHPNICCVSCVSLAFWALSWLPSNHWDSMESEDMRKSGRLKSPFPPPFYQRLRLFFRERQELSAKSVIWMCIKTKFTSWAETLEKIPFGVGKITNFCDLISTGILISVNTILVLQFKLTLGHYFQ